MPTQSTLNGVKLCLNGVKLCLKRLYRHQPGAANITNDIKLRFEVNPLHTQIHDGNRHVYVHILSVSFQTSKQHRVVTYK